jgi:hypothetical protein
MNRLPPELIKSVARLIRAGWRNIDIAKEIGVHEQTVSRYRRMMGVQLPQKALYPQIVGDAQVMPIAHVARKYGYSRQQIYNILRCV